MSTIGCLKGAMLVYKFLHRGFPELIYLALHHLGMVAYTTPEVVTMTNETLLFLFQKTVKNLGCGIGFDALKICNSGKAQNLHVCKSLSVLNHRTYPCLSSFTYVKEPALNQC